MKNIIKQKNKFLLACSTEIFIGILFNYIKFLEKTTRRYKIGGPNANEWTQCINEYF